MMSVVPNRIVHDIGTQYELLQEQNTFNVRDQKAHAAFLGFHGNAVDRHVVRLEPAAGARQPLEESDAKLCVGLLQPPRGVETGHAGSHDQDVGAGVWIDGVHAREMDGMTGVDGDGTFARRWPNGCCRVRTVTYSRPA